jgi:hypothetical protein
MAFFTTKQLVFFGPLVMRGFDVRGFVSRRRREQLNGGSPSLGKYFGTWLGLLAGRTFRHVDEMVQLGPGTEQWSLRQRR